MLFAFALDTRCWQPCVSKLFVDDLNFSRAPAVIIPVEFLDIQFIYLVYAVQRFMAIVALFL